MSPGISSGSFERMNHGEAPLLAVMHQRCVYNIVRAENPAHKRPFSGRNVLGV